MLPLKFVCMLSDCFTVGHFGSCGKQDIGSSYLTSAIKTDVEQSAFLYLARILCVLSCKDNPPPVGGWW